MRWGRITPRVPFVLGVILWVAALALPAVYTDSPDAPTLPGYVCLIEGMAAWIMGYLAIFAIWLLQFATVIWAGVSTTTLAAKNGSIAWAIGPVAMANLLWVWAAFELLSSKIPENEAGTQYSAITALGPGFVLWALALVLLSLPPLVARRRASKDRSTVST